MRIFTLPADPHGTIGSAACDTDGMRLTGLLFAGAVALAACGGGSGGGDAAGGSDATGGGDGGTGGDAGGGDWQRLIAADWSLDPPSESNDGEGYFCATKTITEDTYIGAIRSLSPPGTHHTTLDVEAGGGPDDPGSPCNVEFGKLYAAGVGTGALELPEGVGLKVAAGQKVRINLHLFNATDVPISGTSGIEVITIPAEEVVHEAEMGLSGPLALNVTEGVSSTTHADSTPAGTIVALFPHMHQLGTHAKVRHMRGGSEVAVLWDRDYDFEAQSFDLLPAPAVFEAGDQIETTCTWNNTTGSTVHWGDSSTAEMCFSLIMFY